MIGERWHHDVLVNPERYGFRLPRWLLRLGHRLVPEPDLVFLLAATPELVHLRKPELEAAEIADQIERFRALLAGGTGGTELDTGAPIPETLLQVQSGILRATAAKTARRLASVPQWRGFGRVSDTKVWRLRGDSAGQALRLYHPGSLPGRLAKSAASLLPARLSDTLFFRACASPAEAARLGRHARVIRQVLGEPAAAVGFCTGTPGPHRKKVAQAALGGSVLAYVKIDEDNRLAAFLDAEVRALARSGAAREASFRVPGVIADVREPSGRYLFLAGAGEGVRPRPLAPDRLDRLFLGYWAAGAAHRVPLEGILSDLPMGSAGAGEEPLLAASLDFLQAPLRARGVRVWPSHGDYAPWNTLLLPGGRLFVYDWEYFDEQAPALQDLFHRVFQPARLVEGIAAAKLVERLLGVREHPVYGPVVQRSELTGAELPAYLVLYLLGSLRRRGGVDAAGRAYLLACLGLVLARAGHRVQA